MKKIIKFIFVCFIFTFALVLTGCKNKDKNNDDSDKPTEMVSSLDKLIEDNKKEGIQLHIIVKGKDKEQSIVFGIRGDQIWHVDSTDSNYNCYFDDADASTTYTWNEEYQCFVYNHVLTKGGDNGFRLAAMYNFTDYEVRPGGTMSEFEEKGVAKILNMDCKIIEFKSTEGSKTYLTCSWYNEQYGFAMKSVKYELSSNGDKTEVSSFEVINIEFGSAVHVPTVYNRYDWGELTGDFKMTLNEPNFVVTIKKIGNEVSYVRRPTLDPDKITDAYFFQYQEDLKKYTGYKYDNEWIVDPTIANANLKNFEEILTDFFSEYITDDRINYAELKNIGNIGEDQVYVYTFHDDFENASFEISYDPSLKIIRKYVKTHDEEGSEPVTHFLISEFSTDVVEFDFVPSFKDK